MELATPQTLIHLLSWLTATSILTQMEKRDPVIVKVRRAGEPETVPQCNLL